jgi:hypothetical protein
MMRKDIGKPFFCQYLIPIKNIYKKGLTIPNTFFILYPHLETLTEQDLEMVSISNKKLQKIRTALELADSLQKDDRRRSGYWKGFGDGINFMTETLQIKIQEEENPNG